MLPKDDSAAGRRTTPSTAPAPKRRKSGPSSLLEETEELLGLDDMMEVDISDEYKTYTNLTKAEIQYAGSLTDDSGKQYWDSLAFWSKMETRLPVMGSIARSALCVQATEANTERAFSAAGMNIGTPCVLGVRMRVFWCEAIFHVFCFDFDGSLCASGFTLTDTRTKITTEHMEYLMFVEQNKEHLPTVTAIVARYNERWTKSRAAGDSVGGVVAVVGEQGNQAAASGAQAGRSGGGAVVVAVEVE